MVRVVRALVHELIKTLIPLIPRMFHHFYGKHSWDKSVSCFLSLSPQLLIFIHTDFTDFTDFVYIVLSCLSHPLSLLPPLSPWRGAGGEAFFLSILSHRFHRFHRCYLCEPQLTTRLSRPLADPICVICVICGTIPTAAYLYSHGFHGFHRFCLYSPVLTIRVICVIRGFLLTKVYSLMYKYQQSFISSYLHLYPFYYLRSLNYSTFASKGRQERSYDGEL